MNIKDVKSSGIGEIEVFKNQSILLCEGVPDTIGKASEIIDVLMQYDINIDLLFQHVPKENSASIGITMNKDEMLNYKDNIIKSLSKISDKPAQFYSGFTKISISGWMLKGAGGPLEFILQELGEKNIEIIMISMSSVRMEFLVLDNVGMKAINIIQKAFNVYNNQ